jgi:Holliday junction resolvasome RuvABC endonuclease subunit
MANLNLTKPKTICAIDASTTSLAFAIFEDKSLIACGKIRFDGKTNYEKVADSCRKTKAFFEAYGDFDAVVIEHTIFINSPKTAADLALVQGAMLGAMSLAGAKLIKSINPIAWQTFIGNGRLTTPEKQLLRADVPGRSDAWYKTKEREFRKQRTIKFVNTYYDKSLSDNDITDAVGVGHYAIHNWDKLA